VALDQALKTGGKLPPEVVPIEIMRFMKGWNCDDFNNAPAKCIKYATLYMNALASSGKNPATPTQGLPEAFKRILRMHR
jgi:hypothetical protein